MVIFASLLQSLANLLVTNVDALSIHIGGQKLAIALLRRCLSLGHIVFTLLETVVHTIFKGLKLLNLRQLLCYFILDSHMGHCEVG